MKKRMIWFFLVAQVVGDWDTLKLQTVGRQGQGALQPLTWRSSRAGDWDTLKLQTVGRQGQGALQPLTWRSSNSNTGHPVFRKFLRLAGGFSD
jgi:hypothetical protein